MVTKTARHVQVCTEGIYIYTCIYILVRLTPPPIVINLVKTAFEHLGINRGVYLISWDCI